MASTRFDHLASEIRDITRTKPGAKKLASMKDLATFLGIAPSHTTKWFSGARAAPVPSANLTLKALDWVCVIRRPNDPAVENLVVPDWATLRYFLFRLCYGNNYDYTRSCAAFNTDHDDIWQDESSSPETLAGVLGVDVGTIKAMVPYPWETRGVEAGGDFALDFLALQHRDVKDRQMYVDFLIEDMVPLTGTRTIPLGFPGGLSPDQIDLVAEATQLRKVYYSTTFALPPWLKTIVM